jgi:ribosome-associated toxin RatA of RatAB toxin-antitoxin module
MRIRQDQVQELFDKNVTGITDEAHLMIDSIFEKVYDEWVKIGKPEDCKVDCDIDFEQRLVGKMRVI